MMKEAELLLAAKRQPRRVQPPQEDLLADLLSFADKLAHSQGPCSQVLGARVAVQPVIQP